MDLLRGPSSGLSRVRRVEPPTDRRMLWWTLRGGRAKMRGWLCWGWLGRAPEIQTWTRGRAGVPDHAVFHRLPYIFHSCPKMHLGPSDLSCVNHRDCCPHLRGQAQERDGEGLVVSMVWVQSCWLSAQERGISPLPTKGHLPPPDPRGLSL